MAAEAISFEVVEVDRPDDANVIIGQAHFIKTVEDLHEALAGASPRLRFGLAFCEASAARLVRRSGNDDELVGLATENARRIGAGHSFVVLLRDAIRLGGDSLPADVTITYANTMGIRYPDQAACAIPPPATWDGPVLAQARRAHRSALAAAIQHAAAAEALRVLEDETALTRYRLKAVRDRWIPRLEQALTEVTFAIEELERADAARLRRAAGQVAVAPADRADVGAGHRKDH